MGIYLFLTFYIVNKMGKKENRTEPIEDFYTIEEELGRGSFSIVKRCVRKTDGKQFAVKLIDKGDKKGNNNLKEGIYINKQKEKRKKKEKKKKEIINISKLIFKTKRLK